MGSVGVAEPSHFVSVRKNGHDANEFVDFYIGLRACYIRHVLAWRSSNPLRWNLILERLHIENDDLATGRVQEKLERPFVFCKYAGYCLEDRLFDFIEVAPVTWLGLLLAIGVFYLFSIFVNRTRLYDCMFVFGGLAIAAIVGILILMRKQNKRVSNSSNGSPPPLDLQEGMSEDNKKGKVRHVMHQVHVNFNTEYLFARTL